MNNYLSNLSQQDLVSLLKCLSGARVRFRENNNNLIFKLNGEDAKYKLIEIKNDGSYNMIPRIQKEKFNLSKALEEIQNEFLDLNNDRIIFNNFSEELTKITEGKLFKVNGLEQYNLIFGERKYSILKINEFIGKLREVFKRIKNHHKNNFIIKKPKPYIESNYDFSKKEYIKNIIYLNRLAQINRMFQPCNNDKHNTICNCNWNELDHILEDFEEKTENIRIKVAHPYSEIKISDLDLKQKEVDDIYEKLKEILNIICPAIGLPTMDYKIYNQCGLQEKELVKEWVNTILFGSTRQTPFLIPDSYGTIAIGREKFYEKLHKEHDLKCKNDPNYTGCFNDHKAGIFFRIELTNEAKKAFKHCSRELYKTLKNNKSMKHIYNINQNIEVKIYNRDYILTEVVLGEIVDFENFLTNGKPTYQVKFYGTDIIEFVSEDQITPQVWDI